MKHFFFGVIFSFFSIYSSFGFIAFTEPSCFREVAEISPIQLNNPLYISSKYNDILPKQGENILEVRNENYGYKYIPFNTNISQNAASGRYYNTYSFSDIDSDSQREIVLSFDAQVPRESFYFNFSYDSQYFIPKYYISENGDFYSQVLKQDISDYDIKNIKIIFEPKGTENIREIIKIQNIAIIRNTHIFSISGIDISNSLTLYGGNTCGPTREETVSGDSYNQNTIFTLPIFSGNIPYQENTLDTDGDGISDLRDNCTTVQNRDQTDINQNGVGDICEFDSDGDKIPDEIDNCRNVINIHQDDDDHDSIGNACDNCLYYNPTQADTDENGIGDTCDQRKSYLESNDDDGDGIENLRDNCKDIANPDQADSDNDSVGDMCDNCKVFQNTNQADLNENGVGDICEDSDNDGVESLEDNCMNIPNPDQNDSDNDGIGDVCEDDDRDSILFLDDNCPYDYNPEQRDFDSDAIGDACDEEDNRFLESNKEIFILLMILIITGFIGGIYIMAQKLKK